MLPYDGVIPQTCLKVVFAAVTALQLHIRSCLLAALQLVCMCTAKARTLMRTSLARGGATSISSITTGFLGSQATAALHLMTWRAVTPV